MTTIGDIKDGIRRVFEDVDGIVGELGNYSNTEDPILEDQIPGYFINGKTQARHEFPAAGAVQSTRTFFVLIVVSIIPDGDPKGMEAAYEALEPFLDAIPLAFAANRVLEDANGVPIAEVAGVTALIDDQPEEITRETTRYTAIPYRIAVTTNRSL
jgi:hypothetical protein